jgi:ribonuclease BN (tRNA processing enzyme)
LNGSGKFPPGAAPSPFVEFIRGVDVLILDSQYDCAEYARFTGWGHGCVDDAVEVAVAAGVRRLIMFHHDPEHDDARIDAMLEHARRLCGDRGARLVVDAAFEGLTVPLRIAPVSSWDV